MQLRPAGRFRSIEDVVQRTGLRRDELTTLADIGALNAFTNERRSALWQVERAVGPQVNCSSGIKNDRAPTTTNPIPDPDPRTQIRPDPHCEPWIQASACRPITPAWA